MDAKTRRKPRVKHIVKLSDEERKYLSDITSKGQSSAKRQTHARILLQADESEGGKNCSDKEIADQLGVTKKTVMRVRQRCVEEGLESALNRKSHSRHKPRILGGVEEAKLIKIACSSPPEGRSRWTLNLLTDRLIELEVVEQISATTVGRTLKKTNLNLG